MSDNVTYETKTVSRRERIISAIVVLLFLPPLLSIPATWIAEKLELNSTLVVAWIIISYAISIHVAWKTFREKEVIELVLAEKTPEEMDADKEAGRKFDEFFDKWWVRYPLGVVLLLVAGYLYDAHPNKWIWPLLIALFGVLALRELLLVGIGIGAIWLLVQGIVALPVSIAIIIGAMIIAAAINNRG